MSSALQEPPRKLTVAEYLAFEEQSEVRHEFYQGELFARAGGTESHSRLKVRMVGLLDAQTRKGSCRTYDADMRVKVEANGMYTYPDASVACGRPQFDDDRKLALLNPVALFEVLSKSTEAYDRGTKFERYLLLDSLRHYVLISQARRRIDVFTRDDAGDWRFAYVERPGDVIDLEHIGCRLSLDELYVDIELQPAEENVPAEWTET